VELRLQDTNTNITCEKFITFDIERLLLLIVPNGTIKAVDKCVGVAKIEYRELVVY